VRPRVGFLGMGTMGGPMARRLVQSGFSVTGYDVSAERGKAAAKDGVTIAKSPAAAAETADVVLSSLPNPAAIRSVYLGADGA
jgi:3-hydroxyisobutyrate dehydrogenase-like beta-hydroxyacid dehydrogenase